MSRRTKIAVAVIVAAAFLLRLYNLAGHDMAGDDALYSFRSIGYVDYVAAWNVQSTPVTWFDEPQWWQGLSFHDHPPLVFAIQWLFFKLGGVNLWSARLPFVIAGTVSVFVTFLVGRVLFGAAAGLAAAAALAISSSALFFSRTGYLDGFLVLWILLSVYFFLKADKDPRHYLWWAASLAAGMLTKYTFIFTAPLFLLWLLVFRRTAFRLRQFYFGVFLFLILLSPVIIYNGMMWQTRGHPDAALSTMLGLYPEDFKGLTREVGGTVNIFSPTAGFIREQFSIGFQVLLLLGLIFVCRHLHSARFRDERSFAPLAGLLFAAAVFSLVGGAYRFSAILLPFIFLLIGVGVARFLEFSLFWKRAVAVIFALAIIGEFVFAVREQYLPYRSAYNTLDRYIEKFYEKSNSGPTVNMYIQSPQLEAYQEKRILAMNRRAPGLPPHPYLLVYDDRLAWFQAVWTFERRRLYEAIPIHQLSQFIRKIQEKGDVYYKALGITDIIIVTAADGLGENKNPIVGDRAAIESFVADLAQKVKPMDEIRRPDGAVLFQFFRIPLI